MANPDDWQRAFKELDPDVQERVTAWINTQMFIARELGLEAEKWFEYVEWAFKYPFDFEFAHETGVLERAADMSDGVESKVRSERAASTVGTSAQTKLPGGGGPGNVLQMVADGKKSRDE